MSGLYRSFLWHDGVMAAVPGRRPIGGGMAPGDRDAPATGPRAAAGVGRGAELLAMAVDPAWQGRGVGGQLVTAFLDEVGNRGLGAAHVVVGADNARRRLPLRRAGFVTVDRFELHPGTESLLMQWDQRIRPTRRAPVDRPSIGACALVVTAGGDADGHRGGPTVRGRRPARRPQTPDRAGALPRGRGRLRRGGRRGRRRSPCRASFPWPPPWASGWPTTGSTCRPLVRLLGQLAIGVVVVVTCPVHLSGVLAAVTILVWWCWSSTASTSSTVSTCWPPG